ncbi:hypothetical protein BZB76_5353 [Actinomadura pelletieri DSM 43383]|uniref:Uncharacterized protein n=1 Tax=Actinomadura pelletieri DSM 43383 TaxID=1120940 RepID=A0A495QGG1_9ACTN|nr:hypothetical protein [Actinomadura pelletieri]RKS70873.1 hypothetical protein BZB76_5353 [Actinomadura pelletieri DSM 43383]
MTSPQLVRLSPAVRRNAVLGVAYGGLLLITGFAAVVLFDFSVDVGLDLVTDPQDDRQRLAAWRGAAVLAYTSGSEVGQVCAVIAGALAVRWLGRERRWARLVAAVGAGAGLATTGLGVARWMAADRMRELARNRIEIDEAQGIYADLDPALRRHGCVLAAIAVAFVLYLVAAGIGGAAALLEPLWLRSTVLAVLVVAAILAMPVVHYLVSREFTPSGGSG